MATRMSRVLAGSLRGRLYSTKVATKESATSGITEGTVNDIKVAIADNGGPISRMTFMVKAGSRYEDSSNMGVTHLIRHMTQMSTINNSALKVMKELEISGGNVSTHTTRDYAIVSMTCGRNTFSDLFSVIAPGITRSEINRWDEYNPTTDVCTDLGFLQTQPYTELLELLHGAAYRSTLGNSLYMSPRFVNTISNQQILDFMTTNYRPTRAVVAATNIEPEEVAQYIGTLKFADAKSQAVDTKASYLGGDNRLPVGGLDTTYVAFATEGPSLSSPELLSAGVLQCVLGSNQENVKYGAAYSKLNTAVQKVTNSPIAVSGLNCNYTDSGLFGFMVSASPADIDKVLRTAYETFVNIGKSGLTDQDVQRAKNRLKANIVTKNETGDGYVLNLAEQLMGSDKLMSLAQILKMVDAVTTADVANAAKKFASGKGSLASIGDINNVPLVDQLVR